MVPVPLPATKQHRVYDDPSGVRTPAAERLVTRARVRLTHREA